VSDRGKGCAMMFGIVLVMVTGVVMVLFVYLPLRLFVGVRRLLGGGPLSRPHPRNRRD